MNGGELPSSLRVRVRPVGLLGGAAMIVVWVVLAALVVALVVVVGQLTDASRKAAAPKAEPAASATIPASMNH